MRLKAAWVPGDLVLKRKETINVASWSASVEAVVHLHNPILYHLSLSRAV